MPRVKTSTGVKHFGYDAKGRAKAKAAKKAGGKMLPRKAAKRAHKAGKTGIRKRASY